MLPRRLCFSISLLAAGALALQTSPEQVSLGSFATYLTVPLANIHDQDTNSKLGWKSVHRRLEQVQIYMDGQGYRQELRNEFDCQYLGNFTVAGQPLTAVLDTGSFELVVLTKDCNTCGKGVHYDTRLSESRRVAGGAKSWKFYNSGSLLSEETSNVVSLGPWKSFNQSMWAVSLARMPHLKNSDFDAIIGLGPPGSQALIAWEAVGKAAQKASQALNEGVYSESLAADVRHAVDKAQIAGNSSTVLRTVNESMFSICLGREKRSNGHLIWNDTSVALHPELFHRVPVATNHSWKVQIRNVRLSYLMNSSKSDIKVAQPSANVVPDMGTPRFYQSDEEEEYHVFENTSSQQLDCLGEGGCRALIDSGQSVLAMPMHVAKAFQKIIGESHIDCNNMLELPHLVFEMHGKTFSLAPDAFVAHVKGESRCILLVDVDIAEGDHWVFGMPFFRKYYTTFQVGPGVHNRALYFAGASEQCTPIKSRVQVNDGPPELWRRTVSPQEDGFRLMRWSGLGESL